MEFSWKRQKMKEEAHSYKKVFQPKKFLLITFTLYIWDMAMFFGQEFSLFKNCFKVLKFN